MFNKGRGAEPYRTAKPLPLVTCGDGVQVLDLGEGRALGPLY